MTTIEMARASHLDVYGLGKDHEKFVASLERFATLIRADERSSWPAEMAAGSYDGKGCSIEQAWNCLLAAAPQPAQQEPVTDEENEKFSRDVSNFKGADPEATKHALEEFLRNRVPAIGDIRAAGAIRARRNT